MISLWRSVQILLLIFFLTCLVATVFPGPQWLPAREFFHLDPLLVISVLLTEKKLVSGLIMAVIVLLLTFFLGRFFCGYICPLGTTVDAARFVFRSNNTKEKFQLKPYWPKIKYLFLLLLLVTAILGFNAVHFGSPMSLVGRFYVLVLGPIIHFLIKPLLQLLGNVPLSLELSLPLANSPVSQYQALLFFIPLFLIIFGLSRITPRFWCRYLCPAGAVFSLIGSRPLFRRHVDENCIDCGLCQKKCPMQAISLDDPRLTDHSECIVCQRCLHICPVQAISFPIKKPSNPTVQHLPGRRAIMQIMVMAGLTTALGRLGLHEYWPDGSQGHIASADLIRPPGALPEKEFLNQCVRCGLCFKVCPTNMLQPAWLELGLSGLSSPIAVSRRGPCEPQCSACGQVCPTGAIRPLPLNEKKWAKMGTASINPSLCLAWEFGRSCLVCDEACPYGAIDLKRVAQHKVAVPFVLEDACSGCGFCEYSCPVQGQSAITVTPTGALRLKDGSYRETAKRLGLNIGQEKIQEEDQELKKEDQKGQESQLPPGFSQ